MCFSNEQDNLQYSFIELYSFNFNRSYHLLKLSSNRAGPKHSQKNLRQCFDSQFFWVHDPLEHLNSTLCQKDFLKHKKWTERLACMLYGSNLLVPREVHDLYQNIDLHLEIDIERIWVNSNF